MPKKLRRDPIYIAPEIKGWLNESGQPQVIDERNRVTLDPSNIDDKVIIYERQVNDWFLSPATNLINYKSKNKEFIVLMICLSYLEGVEQYRQGQHSNRRSEKFFVSAMDRMYPNRFQTIELEDFYSQARCGLFHNGMVRGRILISNQFHESIEFIEEDIKVNPKKFLNDIKKDFQKYLQELKTNEDAREKFNQMYANT